MDYGDILTRGWRITWNNKFLWVLGFLAALGSAGGGSNSGSSVSQSIGSGEVTPEELLALGGIAAAVTCLALIIGIVLWLLSLVGKGGLISAVDRLDDGDILTFSEAFAAGTSRLGRLVGMTLLLWLPFILIALIVGVIAVAGAIAAIGGTVALSEAGEFISNPEVAFAALGTFGLCIAILICILVPLVIQFIYAFALRGLVLQELGAMDSIRHGWRVLRDNTGEIVLLALLFFVIGLVYSAVVFAIIFPASLLLVIPTISIATQGGAPGVGEIVLLAGGAICLGLLGAVLNSIITAWRSASFTLAYKQFVGKSAKPITADPIVE